MSRPQPTRSASTNLGASPTSLPLAGRVGIVTGAARGIGAAIARQLASKGCNIVLNYTSESSTKITEDLAAELTSQYGIQAVPVQANVGEEQALQHIVEVTKNHFQHPKTGKFQIDIIVNNAGVAGNEYIQDVTCAQFTSQFNINVRGPLLLIQAALPYLPNDRSGRIINVSSVSSSLGYKGQSIYGATKAALESMTRTWARELAERATVNAINPGPVSTEMYNSTDDAFVEHNRPFIQNTPLSATRRGVDADDICDAVPKTGGRAAYVEEIAGVVGMLCLSESAWTTGSVVSCNGGMIFGQ